MATMLTVVFPLRPRLQVKLAVTRDVMTVDPHGPIMNRQTGQRYAKKSERQVLEVLIERGMKDGQQLRFEGKGDIVPDSQPGDVVIVIKEREHATFQRKGADLIMKKEITLLEALTGENPRAMRALSVAAPLRQRLRVTCARIS